jgi:2-oxoglutarate ferredoxin oxidoreductase subunit alpha
VYVVEQNRDGQMASLIKLELSSALGSKMRSIRHYSGLPIDARFVSDAIIAAEDAEKGAK